MSNEDISLAYELFGRLSCYKCKNQFYGQYSELNRINDDSSLVFTALHTCPGCDTEYNIQFSEMEAGLSVEAYSADQNPDTDFFRMYSLGFETSLKMKTHQLRNLLDSLDELNTSLKILWINGRRIMDACEEYRDNGFELDGEFNIGVIADLHNYFASAYSFDQILHTTEKHLPTNGPIVHSRSQYKEKYSVIEGLRVYSQHNLTIPVRYSSFYNPDIDDRRETIVIPLDEVQTIESDKERFPPYGYKGDDEEPDSGWNPYSEIGFDKIDVEYYVKNHFNAAKFLCQVIREYTYEQNEDEFKDYIQLQQSL